MPICPHCGFQSRHSAIECPLCGTRLSQVVPRPERTPAGRVAWEDPSQAFPGGLYRTWRESLCEPTAFFPRLAWEDSLARPILYYLLVWITSALFVLFWRSTDAPLIPGSFDPAEPLAPLVQFFFEPFAALIALGVAVPVLQLFAFLLAPKRRGMRATGRVFCYSAGPTVFTLAPILGPAVGAIWSLVLLVIGLRAAHRTTTGRATAIVLIPLAGLLLLVASVVVLMVLAGLASGELLGW